MKYKLATTLLVVAALVVATFSAATTTARPARAAVGPFIVDGCPEDPTRTKKPPCDGDNVILRWDEQLLSTIRAHPPQTGPTIAARALGVLHTATYDAWAAYDPVAKVTRATSPEGPAQQVASRINEDNKKKAISYAAARVLNDLFPVPSVCASPPDPPTPFCPTASYKTPNMVLVELGYPVNPDLVADPKDPDADPAAVGNLAAKAVLDFRHGDGSNQLNNYADTTTGYQSVNTWNALNPDPLKNGRWRWQPLCVLTALGVQDGFPPVRDPNATSCPDSPSPSTSHYVLQRPLTPHWGKVTPFSAAPSQYKVLGPPRNANGSCCSTTEIVTAVNETSSLSDSARARVEYWADGPRTEFPPGHAAVFAQALSRKQGNSLDTDAKLFFLIGNAMLDASIASWYQKFFGIWPNTTTKFDFARPITAIRKQYEGKSIPGAWLGPGKGFAGPGEDVPAEKWLPYQAVTVVTPAFPEYVSGHSTFTSAGSTMLAQFNGGDTFGGSVIFKKFSSKIDPSGPTTDVTLTWPTFTNAANDAGMSRRWGGIHFATGDAHGRGLGQQVATKVWGIGQNYIKGYFGK
jgi:hypothetical protein